MRKKPITNVLIAAIAMHGAPALGNDGVTGTLEHIAVDLIRGHVCLGNDSGTTSKVRLFVNGPRGEGVFLSDIAVSKHPYEARDNSPCLSSARHEFVFRLGAEEKSRLGPGKHNIYAYTAGSDGTEIELAGSPRTIYITGRKKPVHSLYNLNTECRYFNAQDWSKISVPQPGCERKPAWSIRGTVEDANFGRGIYFLPIDPLLLGSPFRAATRHYWHYSFSEKPDGLFRLVWTIDKFESQVDVARYSGGFVNDVTVKKTTTLDKNIFIDLHGAIVGKAQRTDTTAGPAKLRTTIGVVAKWNDQDGRPMTGFVEVNIFRTPNFDLCTETENLGGQVPSGPCDPAGIYDRRSYYGGGEIVYYNVTTLGRTAGVSRDALGEKSPTQEYTIPIAELFRRYSWARPPRSWTDVAISGIYIGHEIWGKGLLAVSFEDYRVYEFAAY